LVRQPLTETLMLFALGSAAGILLGKVMTSMLFGLLPALPIPVHVSLTLDWRVVASTCAVSLVAALLSGLSPALHASRADVSTVLKTESPGISRASSPAPWLRHRADRRAVCSSLSSAA
jgi:ABC-type antimicrobial peptide transport system permease subunit